MPPRRGEVEKTAVVHDDPRLVGIIEKAGGGV